MSPASPSAPPGYTAKQGQYLAFIHAYRRLHNQAPAEADIQRFFRVSPPSVHQMILKLEQAGLITRQPGVARSITLAIDPKALPELDPRHDQPVKITVQRYYVIRGYNWRPVGPEEHEERLAIANAGF